MERPRRIRCLERSLEPAELGRLPELVQEAPGTASAVHGVPRLPLAPPRLGTSASVTRRLLATVLFADVVDSTARAMSLGDARWLLLERAHHAVVVDHVRRFRGRVMQQSGDGTVAVFTSSAAAVHCATALVDAARQMGLDLRAGLHAGECVREGRHLSGLVFHVGARVVALASPGEVLVSQTVHDLVLGSDLAFSERGRHELRGFPGEWTLYAAL